MSLISEKDVDTGWKEVYDINNELAKEKKVRSMKCCICDKVKKTVVKVIDPLTLKYDGIKEIVPMCPECYSTCDGDD